MSYPDNCRAYLNGGLTAWSWDTIGADKGFAECVASTESSALFPKAIEHLKGMHGMSEEQFSSAYTLYDKNILFWNAGPALRFLALEPLYAICHARGGLIDGAAPPGHLMPLAFKDTYKAAFGSPLYPSLDPYDLL